MSKSNVGFQLKQGGIKSKYSVTGPAQNRSSISPVGRNSLEKVSPLHQYTDNSLESRTIDTGSNLAMTGTSFNKLKEAKEDKKLRNDIKEIRHVKQLRFVNLDLESPNMREAMAGLGMLPTEINTNKTINDFIPTRQ
jgi:hypothetical protein